MIPAGVAAKETRLIDVKSTIILFCNYFGTLFTGCLIDRGQLCFSQQKKFLVLMKRCILFYFIWGGGGLRIHEFCAKLGLLLPVNSIVLECHCEKYLTCTG